jgi:AcrR family transcriptional regulator
MSTAAAPAAGARRHDAEATRAALIAAAAALFDERGYTAATVRDIGERAGVDPALIARYFGCKEGLYLAAIEREDRPPLPAAPAEALTALLRRCEQQGPGPIGAAIVSPALSDAMREKVRAVMARHVVEPLAAGLDGEDADMRAELLVALATGVALTRGSGTLPALAAASMDEIAALLEPLVAALTAPR